MRGFHQFIMRPAMPGRRDCSTDMPRESVQSSAIAAVHYDRTRGTLDVEFKTGRLYRYRQVPSTTYRALMAAGSKGRFYNHQIRDEYPYTRLR
jgi:hypothetical protein